VFKNTEGSNGDFALAGFFATHSSAIDQIVITDFQFANESMPA
jgi:hypothetical protein